MSSLESRALPLPYSLSLSVFLLPCFFSLFASPDCSVPLSSFLQGDTVDMPWAKGNLFCTSSMHHVAVSVDSTSWKCVPDRKAYINLLQCARSPCYSCRKPGNAAGIQFSNESVPHIWLLDWAWWVALWSICCATGFVGHINVKWWH